MACERCVNRRDFLATAAGGVVLAVTTACGDGQVSGVSSSVPRLPPNVPPTDTVTIVVATFPQLANTGVLVKISSFFAAKRTGTDTFDAFSMACSHEGCLTDISTDGQRFECPCHGSIFASDGSVIRDPATYPLQKLPTSYNTATDTLTVN
jgi:Rieske Fe-S protein